jgi:hypothetical protein
VLRQLICRIPCWAKWENFGAARNLDYVYTGALGRLYHNQVYSFIVRRRLHFFTSNRFVEAFRYSRDAATVSSQLGYNSQTPRSFFFVVQALSVDSHGLIAGLYAVISSDRSCSAYCDCMRPLPPVAAGNMNSGAIIR